MAVQLITLDEQTDYYISERLNCALPHQICMQLSCKNYFWPPRATCCTWKVVHLGTKRYIISVPRLRIEAVLGVRVSHKTHHLRYATPATDAPPISRARPLFAGWLILSLCMECAVPGTGDNIMVVAPALIKCAPLSNGANIDWWCDTHTRPQLQ
jgi:hypothetical protein